MARVFLNNQTANVINYTPPGLGTFVIPASGQLEILALTRVISVDDGTGGANAITTVTQTVMTALALATAIQLDLGGTSIVTVTTDGSAPDAIAQPQDPNVPAFVNDAVSNTTENASD
jgi:hypothetical protein